MEPIDKAEWHTPSLVPLSGVASSAAAKVPFVSESTTSTLPVPVASGTPSVS